MVLGIVKWLKCCRTIVEGRKEGNVLFNDALNTFYLRLYGIRHMVEDHSDSATIGYSFRLTARVLLYAPSHRQDSTYHSLCYTSRGALAGMRNSSMGPPHERSIRWPIAPWAKTIVECCLPHQVAIVSLECYIWCKNWAMMKKEFWECFSGKPTLENTRLERKN